MKISLLELPSRYPIVLLPDEVLSFISEEMPFSKLCEEADYKYPEIIETAHSNFTIPFRSLQFYSSNPIYRTLEEINALNHDSQDYALENYDFFCGAKKLPKKPAFYNEVKVKSTINYFIELGV